MKTKLAKMNQKLLISNIVPNDDTSIFFEKRVESKKTKATPKPETSSQDLGKTIFPSINLAIAQNTIVAVNPKTKSKPFEVSTGILVKGIAKRGSNIITKNIDKNESLSNMFVRIMAIILYVNNKKQ